MQVDKVEEVRGNTGKESMEIKGKESSWSEGK